MTRPVRLRLSRKKGFNLQEHSLALNNAPPEPRNPGTRYGWAACMRTRRDEKQTP